MSDEIVLTPEPKTENVLDPTYSIDMARKTLDKILNAASVEAVYAAPIQHGETIIIPSAEVVGVAGFGYGTGGGKDDKSNVGGGGGGGWGRTFSRPVAAIVIEPNGVRVEPIVDVTKIALAVFTTFGFMAAMAARMSRRRAPKL
jgi:uncharacterized spore protein YtfJ